jgi:hypothetical protein
MNKATLPGATREGKHERSCLGADTVVISRCFTGSEIVVPSFTFAATAQALVVRGKTGEGRGKTGKGRELRAGSYEQGAKSREQRAKR